ncbi:MAG: bifunctional 5,10-methylenetetrahydrofolate dehydrogenase/5,10-methenyltetrahydrofolate cyclohydrolase [Clostridia bacterium]
MLVDVKSIVENKKDILKSTVSKLKRKPKLALINASDDESSKIYINKKRKVCSEIGILESEYTFKETATTQDILNKINELNLDNTVDGILVQLPLFKHLDQNKIINSILPNKDVDGFNVLNLGKLITNENGIVSCTPKGIMMIIDSLNIDLNGLNAVVIGRSIIVGKPIAQLLLNRNATVTIAHSKTRDLKFFTKNADLIVVAAGVPKLLKEDMVNKNCIIIDVRNQ